MMPTKCQQLFKSLKDWQKRFSFSREQESRFLRTVAVQSDLFFRILTGFILIFQLYNICYVLIYTDARLHTVASRIYMMMYLFILIFTLVILKLRSAWHQRASIPWERFTFLYSLYGGVLIFWSVCLTLYDQRVSDNLNVYLIVSLSTAGLIYMKPSFSITVYMFSEILLLIQLPYFQQGAISENYGKYVNSVCLALVACFISLYRNYTLRQSFLNQETIDQQRLEIEDQNKKLDYIANHDALTGLGNRYCLDHYVADLVKNGARHRAAVLMIDIDFFKQYNDTFGHLKGDQCLRKVAETMEKLAVPGKLFRYGGEEFLCLMTDLAEWGDGYLTSIALCWGVEGLELPAADTQKNVTVSVGCTEGIMASQEDFMNLLNQADKALYTAKNTGRNRAVRYGDSSPFIEEDGAVGK